MNYNNQTNDQYPAQRDNLSENTSTLPPLRSTQGYANKATYGTFNYYESKYGDDNVGNATGFRSENRVKSLIHNSILTQINNYLRNNNKTPHTYWSTIQIYHTPSFKLTELTALLTNQEFKLSQKQIGAFCEYYRVHENYVSFTELQSDLSEHKLRHTGPILDHVFDKIKFLVNFNGIDLLQVFEQFDLNKDRVISKNEIYEAFVSHLKLELRREEISAIVEALDQNKDGYIQYVELLAYYKNYANEFKMSEYEAGYKLIEILSNYLFSSPESLHELFNIQPKHKIDQQIFISIWEFEEGFKKLSSEGVEINQLDFNVLQSRVIRIYRNVEIVDFLTFSALLGYIERQQGLPIRLSIKERKEMQSIREPTRLHLSDTPYEVQRSEADEVHALNLAIRKYFLRRNIDLEGMLMDKDEFQEHFLPIEDIKGIFRDAGMPLSSNQFRILFEKQYLIRYKGYINYIYFLDQIMGNNRVMERERAALRGRDEGAPRTPHAIVPPAQEEKGPDPLSVHYVHYKDSDPPPQHKDYKPSHKVAASNPHARGDMDMVEGTPVDNINIFKRVYLATFAKGIQMQPLFAVHDALGDNFLFRSHFLAVLTSKLHLSLLYTDQTDIFYKLSITDEDKVNYMDFIQLVLNSGVEYARQNEPEMKNIFDNSNNIMREKISTLPIKIIEISMIPDYYYIITRLLFVGKYDIIYIDYIIYRWLHYWGCM